MAPSHTPICRASAALCFAVWRLGTGTPPLLTAARLRFLPLPAALGLQVSEPRAGRFQIRSQAAWRGLHLDSPQPLPPGGSECSWKEAWEGKGLPQPSPAFPMQQLADSRDPSCQGLRSQTDPSSNPWVTLGRLLSPHFGFLFMKKCASNGSCLMGSLPGFNETRRPLWNAHPTSGRWGVLRAGSP